MALEATSDPTPHGQLLAAFAKLQKEKDALVALTALQKNDKDRLAKDLSATQKELQDEKSRIAEMVAKLELKSVSAECQIAEVESFSKATLQNAIEKNSKYSEKIVDMQYHVNQTEKEKEELLQRTASLARRDQLQKASLAVMADEIGSLTEKVGEFQNQFTNLATRSIQIHKNDSEQREELSDGDSVAALKAENKELIDRIATLEASNKKLQDIESLMKEKYVQTLTNHKAEWSIEKIKLQKQVRELISEKKNIENQVKEIAELLEKEHVERIGKPMSEDSDEVLKEPTEVKQQEVCNQ